MEPETTASGWAARQLDAVRNDPVERLRLLERCYHGPFGEAPRHLPFRRAAMSFLCWQLRRGVLEPPTHQRPGSPWWRAVNERLLRDGCEAVALSAALPGQPSSPTIGFWTTFVHQPTARNWYRAHNASVVAGFLDHRELAETETQPERFFLNVVLARVLYAHALVAHPRLSLGWLRPLAPLLGDPRLGMTGIFLSLSRILPAAYPLTDDLRLYIDRERGFGRALDYGMIVPRLQSLYEWSARELDQPRLLDCIRDGNPIYAWSYDERDVWAARPTPGTRMIRHAIRPPRDPRL